MLLASQGQIRLAPSGHIIGIDMDAALKIGAARGYDITVLGTAAGCRGVAIEFGMVGLDQTGSIR